MSDWVDFEEIKRKINIKQLLEHYKINNLRKKGAGKLVGLCPIHRNANNNNVFHVSLEKNNFNCFSKCGGGNIIDFVSLMEGGIGIREAALKLQKWFLPESARPKPAKTIKKPVKPKARVNEVNKPLDFKLKLKTDHPYLLEKRGLDIETINGFSVGWCAKGIMAGRICIPLHNLEGKLIGYSGRKIKKTKTDSPKYKFPNGFLKEQMLFNYHRAMEHSKKQLILVEGFFSVFHLWQAGYMNVMALAGTSMSDYQFEVIVNRLRPEKIVTLFDGDEAGYSCREKVHERFENIIPIRSFKLREERQPTEFTNEQLEQILVVKE